MRLLNKFKNNYLELLEKAFDVCEKPIKLGFKSVFWVFKKVSGIDQDKYIYDHNAFKPAQESNKRDILAIFACFIPALIIFSISFITTSIMQVGTLVAAVVAAVVGFPSAAAADFFNFIRESCGSKKENDQFDYFDYQRARGNVGNIYHDVDADPARRFIVDSDDDYNNSDNEEDYSRPTYSPNVHDNSYIPTKSYGNS